MKAIVLFEKPITLTFQKALFWFYTIHIFWFTDKNILIIGKFMPTINTFLPINQKLYTIQKQDSALWKARVMGFSKSAITFI